MDLIEPWIDKELILDFDSTVETAYRGQEKAVPTSRGEKVTTLFLCLKGNPVYV